MTSTTCMVCGHPVTGRWFENCADYYLQTPFVVDYRECTVCHLIQQVPMPTDTSSYYPPDYPMHTGRGMFHARLRKLLIHRIYFVPQRTAKDTVLLDYGCGDGSYLQSIRGRIGRIIGFEPSGKRAEQLRSALGCEMYSSLAEASSKLKSSVDVVTAHFVLEHLTDLDETFRFWGWILKPGGTVHIAVPNIRSYEARLFGKKWHGLDSPRHVSFPEDESLTLLMKKNEFELIEKHCGIFPNLWAASLATVLAGRYNHLFFMLLLPLGFILALLMPQDTSVYTMRKFLKY
ncbi:MAG: class I SAM-dependent methyltransferase [Desulfuromonadales bacterium]